MRIILMATTALLALQGCVGQPIYSKPGATQDEFEVAQARCRMASAGIPRYQSAPQPQTYTATTTFSGNMAYSTVQASGYTAMSNSLDGMSDSLMSMAISMQFRDDCMRAQGFKRQS